ncbi:MAG: peroxiredoxin family protein, partial [Cyanobacteria bacterium]|nr:peroxiredoxin family protein [Cyanobacteriota bacterium]
LSQFVGKKNVVMVFYSGSKCPVCGRQLENIQSHLKDFMTQDAEILAISADDVLHANRTLGEHGLSFSVIPDQNKEIIKKFGITNIQHNGGAYPSCFIIDKQGMVRLSFADPDGKRLHSNELLPELAKITKKTAPSLGYDD